MAESVASAGRLSSKVALITGASRGIGRAIALRFADEGARLLLGYRQDQQAMQQTLAACRERGAEATALAADLVDKDSGQRLVDAALEAFGGLDVLINNAGVVVDDLLPLLSDDDLQAMVETNIVGLARVARAALKPMLKRRAGSIVNISSVLARKPGRGNAIYAGTKGFVEAFTRALAVEVGRKSIRVNAIAPGVIETEMSATVLALAKGEITSAIASRRVGSPDEIAAVAAFLASDEASYINGAIVAADGGYIG